MYNENVKDAYIDLLSEGNPNLKNNLTSLFRKLGRFESELNKDFCDMDGEETLACISRISGKKVATVQWHIAMLRRYVQWCVLNNIAAVDFHPILTEINAEDIDTLSRVRGELASDYEDLLSLTELVFPEFEDGWPGVGTLYKTAILLAFEGLLEEEIFGLDREVIGETDRFGEVNYCGKKLVIHNQTAANLKRIRECDSLKVERGGKEFFFHLPACGPIFTTTRGTGDKDRVMKSYRFAITARYKDYGRRTGDKRIVTIRRAYESGLFYKMYELEQSGGKIDEAVISSLYGIKRSGYGSLSMYNASIKNALIQYAGWKKAFNK